MSREKGKINLRVMSKLFWYCIFTLITFTLIYITTCLSPILEITYECREKETAPWKIQNIQQIILKPIRQNGLFKIKNTFRDTEKSKSTEE